jgi:hypothetical protein
MDEQPAKYGNVHIERENKKEKTHQHKREEYITQERKRLSIERKEHILSKRYGNNQLT